MYLQGTSEWPPKAAALASMAKYEFKSQSEAYVSDAPLYRGNKVVIREHKDGATVFLLTPKPVQPGQVEWKE